MIDILILKCPVCHKTLYELSEAEPFVVAGKCQFCGQLLKYNPEKQIFEQSEAE